MNPSSSPVVLTLQGPAFDSSDPNNYGLTLSYHDSTTDDATARTLTRIFRPVGEYQWQFTSNTGDGRLAMTLGNDHSLTLFDASNSQNTIVLRPGPNGLASVLINGQALATTASVASSYLPKSFTRLAFGTGAIAGFNTILAAGPNAFAGQGYSVAMGSNARAEQYHCVALGQEALAAAYAAIAIGSSAEAHGARSIALGGFAMASGNMSVALGQGYASADYSTALGPCGAWGLNATALAWGSAGGESSVAIGGYAGGLKSTAVASGSTYGDYSIAIGAGAYTYTPHQTIVGFYNEVPDGADAQYSIVPPSDTPLFIVGNGGGPDLTYDVDGVRGSRSNAFSVAWNGNAKVQGAVTVDGGPEAAPAKSVFKRDVDVRGVLRVPAAGDISMGDFTNGANPAPQP